MVLSIDGESNGKSLSRPVRNALGIWSLEGHLWTQQGSMEPKRARRAQEGLRGDCKTVELELIWKDRGKKKFQSGYSQFIWICKSPGLSRADS